MNKAVIICKKLYDNQNICNNTGKKYGTIV